jgi:hypothetical protein
MQQVQQESIIRERAYAIWEQEGRPAGREWDHWARAAHEIASARPATQIDEIATSPAASVPGRKSRSKLRLGRKPANG